MSAAEPAHPGPDVSGSTAAVIPIRHRAAVRLSKRRREATVPDSDTPDTSAHQKLADHIEELFLKHDRRTLTDPETAQVYLITLRLVADMLEGFRVKGVVDDVQHAELNAMIEGMQAAPTLHPS